MPVDEPAPEQRSAQALAAYTRRLRPRRIGYAAVIAAIVLVALAAVRIGYDHSEIAHATLHSATTPAPDVPLAAPSATLTKAWSSSNATAIGTPYWDGTVITYDRDTVFGRDARTGAVRWSYVRTDRVMCTVAQLQGVTMAIYELHGNCDEVSAFDTASGQRDWTRTLDQNAQPILGHPSYATNSFTLAVVTPSIIYAINPTVGYDRWEFAEQGCRINSAVLGTSGALISQTCTHPHCAGRSYCGAGPQLLFRDAYAAANSDETKNPDQIDWNLIGSRLRPVSADWQITAARPGSRQLDLLASGNGKVERSVRLRAAFTDGTGVPLGENSTTAPGAQLVYADGYAYAVDRHTGRLWWVRKVAAPPGALASPAVEQPPPIGTTFIGAVGGPGIERLDPRTGTVLRSFGVPVPAGAAAWPLGTGYVLAGPSTTVYR